MPTFTVSTLADSGVGSLRQAIMAANNMADPDIIEFQAGLSGGTISLTSGELGIINPLTINGLGASNLAVDAGGNNFRVFNINNNLPSTFEVFINGLTIRGGAIYDGGDNGGGIFNGETLTVTGSQILDNEALYGGAIYNQGNLTVSNSTISGNLAGFGGGIDNRGTLKIEDSTISENEAYYGGGGVSNYDSVSLEIRNSTISGNVAMFGGAVYNSSNGNDTATIDGSRLEGNSAQYGGAIDNSTTLSISNSTISENTAYLGGAIYNFGDGVYYFGNLTIDNSTISGNEALYGGAINNNYSLTINDSTISGNGYGYYDMSGNLVIRTVSGGGIENDGNLTLNNSRVSGNIAIYGGGISNMGIAEANRGSTISYNIAEYGGGIENRGYFNVISSTVSYNQAIRPNYGLGGGILSTNSLFVKNSTISGNLATMGGGGIANDALTTVVNSTISYNEAYIGGGVQNYFQEMNVFNSTFSGNVATNPSGIGAGIHNNFGLFRLENTIVANSMGEDCSDLGGGMSININNLIEDGTCNPLLSGDPNLGPLQNNGGPTKTHALLLLPEPSLALNAGNNAETVVRLPNGNPAVPITPLPTDQRGLNRFVGQVDIGSFELQVERVPESSPAVGIFALGLVMVSCLRKRRNR